MNHRLIFFLLSLGILLQGSSPSSILHNAQSLVGRQYYAHHLLPRTNNDRAESPNKNRPARAPSSSPPRERLLGATTIAKTSTGAASDHNRGVSPPKFQGGVIVEPQPGQKSRTQQEARRAKARERELNKTREQKDAINANARARWRNRTQEQKDQRRAKTQARRENMTQDEKLAVKAKAQVYNANKKEEQKALMNIFGSSPPHDHSRTVSSPSTDNSLGRILAEYRQPNVPPKPKPQSRSAKVPKPSKSPSPIDTIQPESKPLPNLRSLKWQESSSNSPTSDRYSLRTGSRGNSWADLPLPNDFPSSQQQSSRSASRPPSRGDIPPFASMSPSPRLSSGTNSPDKARKSPDALDQLYHLYQQGYDIR